jgi:hypothetical protein
MLIQRQLTNTILGDAQRLRKESLELRQDCRNTMCVSRILRHVAQKERTLLASSLQAPSPRPNNPPKGTA